MSNASQSGPNGTVGRYAHVPRTVVGGGSAPDTVGLAEASPRVIPVSVVSNSRLLREGLVRLLGSFEKVNVIAEYARESLVAACKRNPPGHVVLLDGGIGQPAAIQWTQALRALSPPAQVLVLELADDYERILACIEAGANAYLLQGASVEDVMQAVDDASLQRARCSPEMTAHLFRRLAASTSPPTRSPAELSVLTLRELEVLRCIAMDWSNQEIASHLVIELSTVKHHVHKILEKLQSSHRWAAVQVAQERGWLLSSSADPTPLT
jgi:DNA-binding NarL/FixJ family response regulator